MLGAVSWMGHSDGCLIPPVGDIVAEAMGEVNLTFLTLETMELPKHMYILNISPPHLKITLKDQRQGVLSLAVVWNV